MTFTGTLALDYNEAWSDLRLSCVQPKYDGIRCQIVELHIAANAVDRRKLRSVETQTTTRSNGYVPNDYVRALLDQLPVGLDGELVAASNSASGEAQFSSTMSAVSAKAGEPKFKYVVYDYLSDDCTKLPYVDRMDKAWWQCVQHFGDMASLPEWLEFAPTYIRCADKAELDAEVARLVELGYEGAIVRRLDMLHIQGRSSRKMPAVLRIKSWSQGEFVISDVIAETWHDCARNRELRPDLIGRPKDFASSFVCEPASGFTESFRAPLSVTDAVAKEYLANKDKLIGKTCTVRWLTQGCVSRPRLPVCVGIRESFDLGDKDND